MRHLVSGTNGLLYDLSARPNEAAIAADAAAPPLPLLDACARSHNAPTHIDNNNNASGELYTNPHSFTPGCGHTFC